MEQLLFTLNLPQWLVEHQRTSQRGFSTVEERMEYVIELSRMNYRNGTGGPFAAAVFNMHENTLVATGVNMVFAGRCSVLHAEVVALMIAEQKTGVYDLSAPGLPPYELVTSTEPCAMCLGAVAWSGIRKLVCGARGSDAEDAGFDEGDKPAGWPEALDRRGVTVVCDIRREQAAAVLAAYRSQGGIIYNPQNRPDTFRVR